jgi:ABC-type uncharacterized transport system substrate-binding protein
MTQTGSPGPRNDRICMTSSCPCQLVVCRSAEAGALLGLTRKKIVIEFRWAESVEQLPEMAAELVRMKVDIIFASSSTYVEPARHATKTIPIVFAVHADPVGVGHVASLARPGGNITGLSMLLRTDQAREVAEEYANDQREIIK